LLDLFPSRDAGPFGRRQKRARGARIPVTVVTGFLGAGKTTLVHHFLTTPEGRGTAVIIKRVRRGRHRRRAGARDRRRSRAARQRVPVLHRAVGPELTLRRLVTERERGQVPPFARIVIETSGLADPGPVLATFATDRALGGEFFVEVVVAVVDAVGGLATLEWSAESRKQVILADRIVVSKTDLAQPSAVERLTERLALLNPRAAIEIAVGGALDPRCLTEAANGANAQASSRKPNTAMAF